MATCNKGTDIWLLHARVEGSKWHSEWYTKDFYNHQPVFRQHFQQFHLSKSAGEKKKKNRKHQTFLYCEKNRVCELRHTLK